MKEINLKITSEFEGKAIRFDIRTFDSDDEQVGTVRIVSIDEMRDAKISIFDQTIEIMKDSIKYHLEKKFMEPIEEAIIKALS